MRNLISRLHDGHINLKRNRQLLIPLDSEIFCFATLQLLPFPLVIDEQVEIKPCFVYIQYIYTVWTKEFNIIQWYEHFSWKFDPRDESAPQWAVRIMSEKISVFEEDASYQKTFDIFLDFLKDIWYKIFLFQLFSIRKMS